MAVDSLILDMKTVFVDVDASIKIRIPEALKESLPQRIALFTTIQYMKQLDSIKEQMKDKEVLLLKAEHASRPGQLLGCSTSTFDGVNAILFVGDGSFHPGAFVKSKVPVFTYDPVRETYGQIEPKDKGPALRALFKDAKNIGVLISTKPGQCRLEQALSLRKDWADKNMYFLVADELRALEDFPFIDFFVNTACPRLSDDLKPCLNLEDISSNI